jgi:topoisomerase-4 subunit B
MQKSTKFKMSDQNQYTEDNIRSLDWKSTSVCVLVCIGKLGDGSSPDDGIYILLKRCWTTVSMSMGAGKTIEVTIKDKTVTVRDWSWFLLESD